MIIVTGFNIYVYVRGTYVLCNAQYSQFICTYSYEHENAPVLFKSLSIYLAKKYPGCFLEI
jgi:hypothetical protein